MSEASFTTRLCLVTMAFAGVTFLAAPDAQASGEQTYIVLYKQRAVPADVSNAIELAGGTLLHSYDEIGVAIARSDSPAFDLPP
jgi:hypothetical protein